METKITSYSHNSTDGLRYLYYGSYKKTDVISGKVHYNQAHPNHNGVKRRNEFFTGVDCHANYKNAVKDFDFYNRQKPGRKVKAIMLTLSFSKNDFNFRNREDVLRAVAIGRHFVKRAYPNRCAVITAQMDNANATPHLHCFISAFDESNLRAFSSKQKNIYYIRHVADNVVHQYNLRNPNHTITEMTTYRKQPNHHQRTPTPAEMSILKPLKKALALNPTSQASLRRACKKYDLTASFKRGRKRSGGRRKRGRRRSRRGLVFKSKKSNGYIKASQLQYFSKYCPGVDKLHNYKERRSLFKHNWAKYQTMKLNEIKTIAKKMDKSGIFENLYHVGNVDGLDDYKWRAKHNAGVIVSLVSYTSRKDGRTRQSIRYRLAGHKHYYSGYQFVKIFGQRGRRFNNYDVQKQIDKNREAIIHFEDRNTGDFESTFNAIDTTGRQDFDTQLSVTPPTTPATSQPKHESSEPEPSSATTSDDTAKKRREIHDYYQTKQSDRDKIDKFFAKLDQFARRQARAVAVEMRKLRKRSSAWLKKNAIRPLEYRYIQAKNRDRIHSKDINKDPLGATKKLDKSLSPHGQGYLRSTMLMLNSNSTATFKNGLIRQDRRRSGKSYTPFGKLPTSGKTFAHSLNDSSQGLSRREIAKINGFLENDTIISQLKDNHLYKRFTEPERTTEPTKDIKKQRTPVKSSTRLSVKQRKTNERIDRKQTSIRRSEEDKSVKRSKEKSKNYERD